MDKIKLGLFDIFAYLLPGSIIVISIHLIKNDQTDFAVYIFECSKSFTFLQVAILLTISYIIGFLNQYISYEVFKLIAPLFWKKRFIGKETSIGKLENKIVQIRHFSPENFSCLNTWLVFRSMCYSLFISNLLLFIVIFTKLWQWNCFSEQWIDLCIIGISAFLFLRRSVTFHEWIHGTIENSMSHIDDFKNH